MVNERGLDINHTTVCCWGQEYSPEIDKRCRPHLKLTNDSWRVEQTYILVKGKQKYLDRAIDWVGNTLDFLSAKRDAKAAKRFCCRMLKPIHPQTPRVVITVDKNPAYPTIKELNAAQKLPAGLLLRPKYLNNFVE